MLTLAERVAVIAAATVGVGLALLAGRALRRRWRAWIAHEADRFGLRAEVAGDQPVCIGTSLEEAGAPGVPSSTPTLESVEAVLDDGNQRVLHLPAGITLRVRDLEGARRVALESVTSRAGTKTRYTFEVPAKGIFWILDAEGERTEGPSGETELKIPPRAEGYEITMSSPPMPGDLETHAPRRRWPFVMLGLAALLVSWPGTEAIRWWALGLLAVGWVHLVTRAMALATVPSLPEGVPQVLDEDSALQAKWVLVPRPLWLQKLFAAEEWVFAGKRPGPRVLVYDLSDPPSPPVPSVRDDQVGGTASLLADAVWLGTDVPATTATPAVVGRARVQRTNVPTTWEHVATSAQDEDGRNVAAYGQALGDSALEGVALRFRATKAPGDDESSVEGPLPDLASAFVQRLVDRGLCAAASPPTGLGLPGADEVDLYLRVHDRLLLAVMMSGENRFVRSPEPGFHDGLFDLADELLRRAPALLTARLTRIVAAIYGVQAGKLSEDRRARVLEDVRADVDPRSLLHRLSPAILARLGAVDEARARLAVLAEATQGPYRGEPTTYAAWLREVEKSLPRVTPPGPA